MSDEYKRYMSMEWGWEKRGDVPLFEKLCLEGAQVERTFRVKTRLCLEGAQVERTFRVKTRLRFDKHIRASISTSNLATGLFWDIEATVFDPGSAFLSTYHPASEFPPTEVCSFCQMSLIPKG
jgi:hypothetical protein